MPTCLSSKTCIESEPPLTHQLTLTSATTRSPCLNCSVNRARTDDHTWNDMVASASRSLSLP